VPAATESCGRDAVDLVNASSVNCRQMETVVLLPPPSSIISSWWLLMLLVQLN